MMEEILNNKWLKIGLLTVAGLILAGGLVFAGYKLGQRRTASIVTPPTPIPTIVTPTPVFGLSPTPIPSTTIVATPTSAMATLAPDPTANWKTYRNEQYKFEIKYPENKEAIIDTENPFIGICNLNGAVVGIKLYPLGQIKPYIETEFSGDLIVVIDVQPNPESIAIKNWLKQNCQGTWVVIDSRLEEVMIDGNKAIKATGGSMGRTTLVGLNKNQKIYFIYGWSGKSDSSISQIFNQILSTFKFLD